jgi:hypothetical protein
MGAQQRIEFGLGFGGECGTQETGRRGLSVHADSMHQATRARIDGPRDRRLRIKDESGQERPRTAA